MNETKNERKYKSYLQTISFISFLTAIIELILLLFHRPVAIGQIVLAVGSIIVLVIFGFIGLLIAGDTEISEPINKLLKSCNKGRTVTVLFFTHLVCVAIFIVQDGGAQNSCISNILLLDASFGYFFAAKKIVKRMVNIVCIILYLLCFIFYFNKIELVFAINFTYDIISHLLTILFVLGVNGIINSQITSKEYADEKSRDEA